VFGTRGAGKSWLVILLCRAIAEGRKCGPWTATKAWPVLYIDGEMFYEDDKERLLGLHSDANLFDQTQKKVPDNLHMLNHEVLFHLEGLTINVGRLMDQELITKICLAKGIKVLVLDNLSCLASGIKENDTDDWEKIQPWLLDLRRRGVTVVIVHHAGLDASRMRGVTKREDSAAWILRLDDRKEDYSEAGAHFVSCAHQWWADGRRSFGWF
jgi:RecA-family ATPase